MDDLIDVFIFLEPREGYIVFLDLFHDHRFDVIVLFYDVGDFRLLWMESEDIHRWIYHLYISSQTPFLEPLLVHTRVGRYLPYFP